MEEVTTLAALRPGRGGEIVAITAAAPQRRGLMELGFIPGGRIEVLQASPWGDPVAYAVCGAVIALRRNDAKTITIKC